MTQIKIDSWRDVRFRIRDEDMEQHLAATPASSVTLQGIHDCLLRSRPTMSVYDDAKAIRRYLEEHGIEVTE